MSNAIAIRTASTDNAGLFISVEDLRNMLTEHAFKLNDPECIATSEDEYGEGARDGMYEGLLFVLDNLNAMVAQREAREVSKDVA